MKSSLVLPMLAGAWVVSVRASSETHVENVPDANGVSFLQASLEFHQQVDESSSVNHTTHMQAMQLGSMSTSPTDRLENFKPIAWVHVPKTGTSLWITLFGHKGICPNLSEQIEFASKEFRQALQRHHTYCPGGFSKDYPPPGHDGFGSAYKTNTGHGIIFLRQPEQRLISGYNHHDHGATERTPHGWPFAGQPNNLREYAETMQGQTVKMLTRDGEAQKSHPCPYCSSPVSDGEVTLALHRLRSGFPFIGITEEWNLSICLFHAMFGGKFHARELHNTRPGRVSKSKTGLYDTSELQGFRDVNDGLLYDEGVKIFHSNLARYNVTQASCTNMDAGWVPTPKASWTPSQ